MYSHIMLGTNDMEESRRFYDAILGALAYSRNPAGNKLCALHRMA